ncbi:uncharacterized protein [Parasteatoda tepidariorum]|uniref:uncharacterized protein n=1 Tax=Parasteatoda tepidariorum TaxID=114398 RepID=UPI00077FE300|nr:uncharacterized protein LOC107456139 [Parasteatoda tepidariorum]
MWLLIVLGALFTAPVFSEDKCDVSKYVECMEPIHNATFGHPKGIYQDSNDLATSCPIIKDGLACVQKYADECGTEMIAEDYNDQIKRPADFLAKICDPTSPIRREYLKASPCLLEHAEDFEICSTKVQEFLAEFAADTSDKEHTLTCIFEMMLRACLMSTGVEKCGMQTATFVRKALLYSPSTGLKTCNNEE